MKTNSPTHEDIARRAHEIWTSRGNPHGYDIGHWLEAERQLAVDATGQPTGEARPAVEPTQTAGPSGPSPDALAAQAESQKHASRAPQQQHGKNAPKPAPTESGKPLWDKPHSS